MARLTTCGFEQQSMISGVEMSTVSTTQVPTVSTTIKRGSGAASMRSSVLAQYAVLNFLAANGTGTYYARAYFYVATLPAAITTTVSGNNTDIAIMTIQDSSGVSWAEVCINASGVLRFYQDSNTRTVIGTFTVTTGQWYMLELGYSSATTYVEGRVNGVSIGSTTTATGLVAVSQLKFGFGLITGESAGTADIYIDDVAVNDNTGSFQNTWPGQGSVVSLRPNTSGDINTFATQTGGTAGAAFNYTRVNEITPDDATTLNGSNTVNQEDLYHVQPCIYDGSIGVASVNARFRNNVADVTTAAKLEIKSNITGTVTQSAALIPNSTVWQTNHIATNASITPPLTLYQDPNNNNWTQNSLNGVEIGYILSAGSTNRIEFSTIWLTVETTGSIGYKLAGNRPNRGLRPHPFSPGLAR